MKHILFSLLVVCASVFMLRAQQTTLNGAWQTQNGDIIQTAVFVDGYLSHSKFDVKNKTFISTRGGTYTADGNSLTVVWQYDSEKAASGVPANTWVGQSATFRATPGASLSTDLSGQPADWKRIDDNSGPMVGVWRITGRKQGDEISQMQLRDRRTLKILSGTRFQWVAINIKTGEFSGTGGGTYTFENGKYTENIEFFSRDNDRVGALLSFDGKIENGAWHHSGLSSTGNPIYEIWNKLEQ